MSKETYSRLAMLLMGLAIGMVTGGMITRVGIPWLILVLSATCVGVGFYCHSKADSGGHDD